MDLGTYQMKINRGKWSYHVSHMVKHGHQISLPLGGVSFSRLLAGIFGLGMGVAGLIMARKGNMLGLDRSSPGALETIDSSESLRFVAGLQNLGNNCFLNVILQALASCSSFYPFVQSIIDADHSWIERGTENLPLATALASLLKELRLLQGKRIVLNPRKVMSAMNNYVASFNLTRQQDAAEALMHLLSSLQEEILDCYVPYHGSLADIYAFPFSRISSSERGGGKELQQWQQCFLGPFDGTLGSILTCRTCSIQDAPHHLVRNCFHCEIKDHGALGCEDSLDLSTLCWWTFDDHTDGVHRLYVHWRPHHFILSIGECTLEDCLKKFTAIERVHNYNCKHCWHVVATKLLSLDAEENKENIQKVKDCVNHDTCDCKNIFPKGLPWSIDFSCTFKRLSICRCPKVLCIHLQRASMTPFGELIKLRGHVSFPLELDIFPFTAAALGMEIEILKKDKLMKKKQPCLLVPYKNSFDVQTFPFMDRLVAEPIATRQDVGSSIYGSLGDCLNVDSFEDNSHPEIKSGGSDMLYADAQVGLNRGMHQHHYEKFDKSSHSFKPKSCIYRLVAVVEHYGEVGSGHYAVYRRGMTKPDSNGSKFNTAGEYWFYASDTEVVNVSEEAVLAAEAGLLFYERIDLSL